jgi:hypothetical protein
MAGLQRRQMKMYVDNQLVWMAGWESTEETPLHVS